MKRERWRNARALARWHRSLGVVAAGFVLLLATSGILLNHTSDLDLDKRYVHTPWLLDWYGIEVPHAPLSFFVANHWVSQIGARLYFDGRDLGSFGPLIGAVAYAERIAVAAGTQIILLTSTGEVVEILGGEHGVPAGMRALGLSGQALAVRSAHGVYVADAELMRWRERPRQTVQWSATRSTPASLQARLIEAYRGHGVSVERLLRDIHSGRVLGRFGYWLMDVAALALLLLAATGVWLWARRAK